MITEISTKTKITMVVMRNSNGKNRYLKLLKISITSNHIVQNRLYNRYSTDILILRNIPINTYSTHVPSRYI